MNTQCIGENPLLYYQGTITVPFTPWYAPNSEWEEEEETTITKKKNGEEEVTVIRRKRKRYTCPYNPPYVPWYSPTITLTGNQQPCLFENWDWVKNPVAMLSCPCPKCSPRM